MANLMNGEYVHKPSEMFFPGTSAVTVRVPEKIQERIKNDKYVDFKTLLQNELDRNALEVQIELNNGQPTLVTKPSDKKEIKIFDQWNEAFLIYLAIKFPETASMIQHAANVRVLSKTNASWKLYDENFRYWKQENPSWDWGDVNNTLWAQSVAAGATNVSFAGRGGRGKGKGKAFRGTPYGQKRPCFTFHYKNEYCNYKTCSYSHQCPTCGGLHRFKECIRTDANTGPKTKRDDQPDASAQEKKNQRK